MFFPSANIWDSGMCDGHTYEQHPQSMQSMRCAGFHLLVASRLRLGAEERRIQEDGARLEAVAAVDARVALHRPASFAVSTTTPVVPLMIGVSRSGCGAPIMGPPKTISVASSVSPPQNSSTSRSRVPTGTSRFDGLRTPGR